MFEHLFSNIRCFHIKTKKRRRNNDPGRSNALLGRATANYAILPVPSINIRRSSVVGYFIMCIVVRFLMRFSLKSIVAVFWPTILLTAGVLIVLLRGTKD